MTNPINYICIRMLTLSILLSCQSASATADGPDYFQVKNISSNNMLNIYKKPSNKSKVIAKIGFVKTHYILQ